MKILSVSLHALCLSACLSVSAIASPPVQEEKEIRERLLADLSLLQAARAQVETQIESRANGQADSGYLKSLEYYRSTLDEQIEAKKKLADALQGDLASAPAAVTNAWRHAEELDKLLLERVEASVVEQIESTHKEIEHLLSVLARIRQASESRHARSPLNGSPLQIREKIEEIEKQTQKMMEENYSMLVREYGELLAEQERNSGAGRRHGEGYSGDSIPLPPPPYRDSPDTLDAHRAVPYGKAVHKADNATAAHLYRMWEKTADPAKKEEVWNAYLAVAQS
jgi:hypothetical protein